MQQKTIRDISGRSIGTLTTDGDGIKTLRDVGRKFGGKYDPRAEITIETLGRSAHRDVLLWI